MSCNVIYTNNEKVICFLLGFPLFQLQLFKLLRTYLSSPEGAIGLAMVYNLETSLQGR